MEMNLAGRRVLITGGSKGIGLACAQAFAAAGCDLVLVGRDASTLGVAADTVRGGAQVRVEILAADLSQPTERERLHAAFPEVDILVNNAGAIPAGRLQDIPFASALGGAAQASGVRVLGINPAATRTDRMETQARVNAQIQFGDPERWAETLTGLPYGRAIEAAEIADLSVFLASPRAAYINGTVVDVDGGGLFR
jgi:NAD(P)-dependent dehydrogenase (short-subunit alcohol dehydrogenase family)